MAEETETSTETTENGIEVKTTKVVRPNKKGRVVERVFTIPTPGISE